MPSLFDPLHVGDIPLANRVVMAPLTRNRAIDGCRPGPLTVDYYRQRATAGLIIAEASQISPMAQGYLDSPGIHSVEQVAAWRRVTDAVHAEGGRIVLQLWHVGRISHVSSSARTFTRDGFVPVSPARALGDDEIPGLIDDYRRAARNAMDAGFDGVEVHAANTYLLDQFLRDSVNDRVGPYGGGIANRARLLVEVMQAVVKEIGAGRTGIRLSPMTTFGGTCARDSDPQALHNHVAGQLAPLGLTYLHVVEGETGGPRQPPDAPRFDYAAMRDRFAGTWMVNNGYDRATALDAVAAGEADLVAFGRLFICNPDLVRRMRR